MSVNREKGDAVARRYVAYYRVNNVDDLREQVACVKSHVKAEGSEIIRSYRDRETTRRPERLELRKALEYTKRNNASLIIATLKGLSRDVRFLRSLRDSAVDFVACDLSHANSATIHVLTALAEYDMRVASERSRKAAAAYKARGGRLGAARPEGRNLDAAARAKGARSAGKVARDQADQAYQSLMPTLKRLRESGRTLQEIADRLNAEGLTTRRGCPWNAMQVSRVLKRGETTSRERAE